MKINNFKVTIHPGAEMPEGYAELSHNTQYTVLPSGMNNFSISTERK